MTPEKENRMNQPAAYKTRPLTADETETLLRNLTIALGVNGKDAALRAIVNVGGIGIFALDDEEGVTT